MIYFFNFTESLVIIYFSSSSCIFSFILLIDSMFSFFSITLPQKNKATTIAIIIPIKDKQKPITKANNVTNTNININITYDKICHCNKKRRRTNKFASNSFFKFLFIIFPAFCPKTSPLHLSILLLFESVFPFLPLIQYKIHHNHCYALLLPQLQFYALMILGKFLP